MKMINLSQPFRRSSYSF